MITRYKDGTQGIPYHSDDEECIEPGSMICSISLGETRSLMFRSKNSSTEYVSSVQLAHGDFLFMSQKSQKYFEHSVPKDFSNKIRLSITLRQITSASHHCSAPPGISLASPSPSNNAKQDMGDSCVDNTMPDTEVHVSDKSSTVFISSSMFSELDEKKLSSTYQMAHVFSYPGATAKGICQRFQADGTVQNIDTTKVSDIVVMAGSNNVDYVLGSPPHLRKHLLVNGRGNAKLLDETNRDIETLVLHLHKWAPGANIRIVNVLPRESRVRNRVISDINQYIWKLQNRHSFVSYLSTEKHRHLFTDKLGFRKAQYFS